MKVFNTTAIDDYQKFAASFPFEETVDQEAAITAVMQDMGSKRPMDRLVCGDVGFGKTEVAMRAAFIAVTNNKQVIMLVPTTLLAQQHYESFKDRFADWPVKVEVLSRFKSTAEQNSVIQQVKAGQIGILIGTHKLLNTDISYSKLGLLIIDEEHRFGVRQKEKLKALRTNVEILTLTATPIPRTLNMAWPASEISPDRHPACQTPFGQNLCKRSSGQRHQRSRIARTAQRRSGFLSA